MVSVNEKKLVNTCVAALLVIAGVVVKNSAEQLKMANHPVAKPLGMLLFIVGWLLVAKTTSDGRANKLPYVVSSLAVLGSVIGMKQLMAKKKPVPMYYPLVFALAWTVLGYSSSNHLRGNRKHLGLLVPVCVLLSMMVTLPQQRKKCVVDGPGMPLFVIGWALLAYFNSVQA
tara:strand:+ start:493 stop:1008 length:516 start_codon:yes stop_codon:yes gene_type:complete